MIRSAVSLVVGLILILASIFLIIGGAYDVILSIGTLGGEGKLLEGIISLVIGFIIFAIGIWVFKIGGLVSNQSTV